VTAVRHGGNTHLKNTKVLTNMKRIFFLILLVSLLNRGYAQSELLARPGDKGLHLLHTVSAKENFYSIGRLYALSPKDIAAFNNLDMSRGLNIGQTIQIPLNEANFAQASGAQGRPVYYTVGEKEGLYRVSVRTGKALMADLRKWNNLRSDALQTGQKLIVGYLGTASAGQGSVAANPAPANPATSTSAPPSGSNGTAPPPTRTDEPRDPSTATNNTTPVTPRPATADSTGERPARPVTVVPTPVRSGEAPRTAVNDGQGGHFRRDFEQQARAGTSKDATVVSGIFKTTSGWQDMKYYLLLDGAEPGTIVKVSHPTNGRFVYAKVLGAMSGIRQNQGLDIRISNAAASVLQVGEADRFSLRISY